MTVAAIPDWYQGLQSGLDAKLGIEVLELSPTRIVATMPVEGNQQPYGRLHGGASAALLESLGSLGAVAHGYPDKIAVGVDLNITHVRAATTGIVTGVATSIHLGGKIASYNIEIRDDRDRLISTGRITCQLLPKN